MTVKDMGNKSATIYCVSLRQAARYALREKRPFSTNKAKINPMSKESVAAWLKSVGTWCQSSNACVMSRKAAAKAVLLRDVEKWSVEKRIEVETSAVCEDPDADETDDDTQCEEDEDPSPFVSLHEQYAMMPASPVRANDVEAGGSHLPLLDATPLFPIRTLTMTSVLESPVSEDVATPSSSLSPIDLVHPASPPSAASAGFFNELFERDSDDSGRSMIGVPIMRSISYEEAH